MLWLPPPSADVEHVAWLEAFSATALHRVVAPSKKVTVPFAPGFWVAVTVAVKVTLCVYVLGLLLLVTVVVVVREVSTLKTFSVTVCFGSRSSASFHWPWLASPNSG